MSKNNELKITSVTNNEKYLPSNERTPKVVRSPKDAAIGVATLSGLMRRHRETSMTAIITRLRINDATEAVVKLLAHNKAA